MICSLTVHNFQIHDYFHTELAPGLTVFTGETGKGKSALLRCLRWIIHNKPSGDAFLRHGESFVEGTVEVDGHTVTRRKSHNDNLYVLDGQELRAFGRGNVPPPIEELFNVDESSWARQHDPAFLFSQTPGQVAQSLNKIVNLDLIDSTLSNLATDVRRARTELEVCQERLQQVIEKEQSLSWIVDCVQEYSQIKTLETTLSQMALKSSRIDSVVQEVGSLEKTIQIVSRAKSEATKAIQTSEQVQQLNQRHQRLSNLINEVTQCDKEITRLAQQQRRIHEQLSQVKDCPLCGQLLPQQEDEDSSSLLSPICTSPTKPH